MTCTKVHHVLLQVNLVGKERLVLDLSCRKRDGQYYVVTDRWQRFSELVVNQQTLDDLGTGPQYI
jgi:phosphoribosylformimino-5-aminoimidazole carboxamide ribotide isomerase